MLGVTEFAIAALLIAGAFIPLLSATSSPKLHLTLFPVCSK
ncbi:hypothetical protein [Bradyrhizobium sp. 5.13L]